MKGIATGQRTLLCHSFASCFQPINFSCLLLLLWLRHQTATASESKPPNQRVTRTLMNYGRQLANGHPHRPSTTTCSLTRDWPQKIEWHWPVPQLVRPIGIYWRPRNVISQRIAELLCEVLEMLRAGGDSRNNAPVVIGQTIRLESWVLSSGWGYLDVERAEQHELGVCTVIYKFIIKFKKNGNQCVTSVTIWPLSNQGKSKAIFPGLNEIR